MWKPARRAVHRLEDLTLALGQRALTPLPLAVQLRIGRYLGHLIWTFAPRRALSIRNVEMALAVDRVEARRIARAAHLHLGRLFVEFLTADRYRHPERLALLEVENLEHLTAALSEGRGVVVITAHMGNWELCALKQAHLGVPMVALGRQPKNPYLAKRIASRRAVYGGHWLPRERALLRAAKVLQRGGCIATAIDQHAHTPPKIEATFFGRPTMISTGVLSLAVRFGSPVVPMVSYAKPSGGYRIVYHSSLRAATEGERDEPVRELTLRWLALAETWIRREPESWFWFHNLWKNDPDRRVEVAESVAVTR